jgi:hypothetical protein
MGTLFPASTILLTLFSSPIMAQSAVQTTTADLLFRELAAQDAGVFNAYNSCDLTTFVTYFSEDVEFYHDQSGVTNGRAALVDALKKNICGKVTRELVKGSVSVYPMKGYGAIQMGSHRFLHPNDPNQSDGEGKFIHLWQKKDGKWQITRVVSYDHFAVRK